MAYRGLVSAILVGLVAVSAQASFRVVHFNIKELDSLKLLEGKANSQVLAASNILRKLKPDILSINEMQFDIPGVPNFDYQSTGFNMVRLLRLSGVSGRLSKIAFAPANTGLQAKRMSNGNYAMKPRHPDWMDLVDHANFGIFPAQYSTGLASRYKIVDRRIISGLRWKDFRPDLDLSGYRNARGEKYDEESLELFDKNFSDITIRIKRRNVHVILLHTVPAHNFGNDKGLNVFRNADQLRFLEWYLTGKTDFEVGKALTAASVKESIAPLASDAHFIAMGDWNTDISRSDRDGSIVIQRIAKAYNLWTDERVITYESGFSPDPFRSQLDYILVSKSLEVQKAGVYYPKSARIELGCENKEYSSQRGYKKASYRGPNGETCWVLVKKKYFELKTASDHLPIWAKLRFLDR